MIRNKLRLALLISGGGSTAAAIVTACRNGSLPRIEPACIIASSYAATGLEKMLRLGMTSEQLNVINPNDFRSPDAFGANLLAVLLAHAVDLVGQYGWLPKTPAGVIEAYEGKMINQHPGPLDPGRPDFGGRGMFGRRVHCARLYFLRAMGKKGADLWTEVVAQRVSVNYDEGAVLRRRKVAVFPDDDPIILQERALPIEHDVQIEALYDFGEDRVIEQTLPEPLINPSNGEWAYLNRAKDAACWIFPKG